jgi:hypothetical protein
MLTITKIRLISIIIKLLIKVVQVQEAREENIKCLKLIQFKRIISNKKLLPDKKRNSLIFNWLILVKSANLA